MCLLFLFYHPIFFQFHQQFIQIFRGFFFVNSIFVCDCLKDSFLQ